MWVIVSTSKTDEKHPILGDKKYVVGRTGCDITINDPSVSRKQAVLMMAHYEANVVKSFITPSLTIEDTSKFGTFVNGDSVKKKPGSVMTLKDGDKIQFGGSPASVFIARYEPFVATTSCLEKIPKKNLQRVMCLLGGHVVRDWRATCDLLIMAKINVTIKVICAINNQKPIVTPDYLEDFHQFLMGQRDSEPDPKNYLPEVADKEVPAGVSFHPDIRRATLLKDLKFYFLSAHQFNKTNLAVSTAGGLPILLEDGAEEDAEVMTQEGTIVVAVTRDVLSTLSPTCQKFVRTVCLVLKKKNLRMVTDPEIGWAILTCNTDDFCNPKSAITPSMYSSMASQSLSQMTDMDLDMSQHVPNVLDTSTQQQHTSNTQLTATPQQLCNDMPPPKHSQKVDARPGKRSASTVEKDSEDLFSDKVKEESSSSLQSPASKRMKQETQVASSENLFSESKIGTSKQSDSHLYSAPAFRSPQTPAVVDRKDVQSVDCNKVDRKKDDFGNGSQSSLSLSLKEAKSTKSCFTRKSDNGKASSYDGQEFDNVLEANNEGDNDNNNDKNGLSLFKSNSKHRGRSSPQTNNEALSSRKANTLNSLSSGEEKKSSSLSPGGFLNKKGSGITGEEEISNGNKKTSSPTPSTTLSSTKGKRKKRALFCDSSDEEDTGVTRSSVSSKRKPVVNVQNSSDEEDKYLSNFSSSKRKKSQFGVQDRSDVDTKEDIVAKGDFPSSSVICNGDAKVDSVVVKQENITTELVSSHSTNGGGDGASHPLTSDHLTWASVKKEESPTVVDLNEEQKANMDLVLDSGGQPLRHLCQVKVVDLIARVPGSRPVGKDRASNTSQQQTGVKNFKRFKKTVHCGSSRLPTIIGGRDLEPHKGTRLNQMDDMLEEAVTAGNRVREESNNDGMFSWPDEDLAPKRKSKRT